LSKNWDLINADLFKDYQKDRSLESRNKLVQQNIGLVKKLASQIQAKCHENYDDLVQIGCLGLIKAVERFDLKKRVPFYAFALPFIRGEILHYLRDKSFLVKIPRKEQELYASIPKAIDRLLKKLGRLPSQPELAIELNINLFQLKQCITAYENRFALSLENPINNYTNSATCFKEILADSLIDSSNELQQEKLNLQLAMDKLDNFSQAVIKYYYLKDMTQKEAAKILGVCVRTLKLRQVEAIEQLKSTLIESA
jgi:RNA polymerase sigma-B factor